jgi:hypothetical protein
MSGTLTILLYRMTSAIALAFARQTIHSSNTIVQRITIAVRTLVIGMSALGTGIFGLVTLGLIGLGLQILLQRLKRPQTVAHDKTQAQNQTQPSPEDTPDSN